MGSLAALDFSHMQAPRETRASERREDRPGRSAVALPGVADTAQQVAAKISTRLLDTYGADAHPMQGHAA